jgi:rod shape-determining protein MreD
MTSTPLRYTLLVVTAVVLQRGLFSQLRIFDAVPDVLLILAAAAGIAGGWERGALIGFFAGLAMDLMLPTPMGLSALSYLVAGAVVGRLRSADVRSARWRVMALTALGCAIGIVVFALVGAVLGRADFVGLQLVPVLLVTGVAGALLGPWAVRLCRWADADHVTYRPALR